MNKKTPRFEKALEKYFSKLKLDKKGGQERTCRFSKKKFYISPEDITFYKKIKVPLPTLSPHERTRRKLGFFNTYNLFYGESTFTGENIISSYPSNTPYQIYEHTVWNDADFTNLPREYNYQKKFFDQYKKFQLSIPRTNLVIKKGTNSDFANNVVSAKNCYLSFDIRESEDCSYCIYLAWSKDCYHSSGVVKTDICYDCNFIKDSYKVFFSEHVHDCLNSSFLFDCRDCSDCFMCTNLRHKKFCFENKQLDEETYRRTMKGISLGERKEIEKFRKKFKKLKKQSIHRANHNENNVNCTGDYNVHSKNCNSCFYTIQSENMFYCVGGSQSKDCLDSIGGRDIQLSYDSNNFGSDSMFDVKFSSGSTALRNSEYCDLCRNCTDCFACIGLRDKKHCMFNKQYSEKEYFQKIDEIKTKMLADGEYGEFFPPALCTVPYNISFATSYGGYEDVRTAKKYGYKIEDIPENVQNVTGEEILIKDVPDDIRDTGDDILEKIIVDKNGKKFKYTKAELEFHRQYDLALPIEHYTSILARQRIELGPIDFNLKTRKCAKCKQKTRVTFPMGHPDAPKIIYCNKCYRQTVV